jgi:hypothetical protein
MQLLTAERDLARSRCTFIQQRRAAYFLCCSHLRGRLSWHSLTKDGFGDGRRFVPVRALVVALLCAPIALAACDPVLNIAGANFPAWLLCAIVGTILAAGLRAVFAAAGIEPYLGPLLLIYPCLAVLIGCAIYLVFFNRV